MKKREKEIIFEFLHHFLTDGWTLNLGNYLASNPAGFGPLKKSDLTKQGLARLARLMPYLSLRKKDGKIYLEKNFSKESDIPAEHLVLYYKLRYQQAEQDYAQLYDNVADFAERIDLL